MHTSTPGGNAHIPAAETVKVLTFNCLLCFALKGKLAVKCALQTPGSRVRGAAPSPRRAGLARLPRAAGKGAPPAAGGAGQRRCPSLRRADAGVDGIEAGSSSYEIFALPQPRGPREAHWRPACSGKNARRGFGGRVFSAQLPSLPCKNSLFSKLRFWSRIS